MGKLLRIILITVLSIGFVFSIPRFAVRNGTTCYTCHVSPTGGGLRNDYGVTIVSMDELPMQRSFNLTDEDYTGMVGDHLRLGTDIRFQMLNYSDEEGEFNTAFFPMQTDLYAYVQVNRTIGTYLKIDLARGFPEFWTVLRAPSGREYLKIGRKIPTYGLRLDDHTSFIRGGNIRRRHGLAAEGLPFSPLRQLPGILELGVDRSNFFVTVSVSNGYVLGTDQAYGVTESLKDKNITARVEYSTTVKGMNGLAGASVMKEDTFLLRGIFAGLSLGPFIWLGEVDYADNWVESGTNSLASYSEFIVEPIQGLNFLAKYDFFDGDVDKKQRSLARFTAGVELFPMSFLEIKAQVRHTRIYGSGWGQSAEYLFQIHTWF